ncbi:hypothetical protein KCP77_04865 [Salmonella enterica subsp. enterica]|nr:hypothetical protein KCP77_04865 [Salmonella enterica subsp. enterica]
MKQSADECPSPPEVHAPAMATLSGLLPWARCLTGTSRVKKQQIGSMGRHGVHCDNPYPCRIDQSIYPGGMGARSKPQS